MPDAETPTERPPLTLADVAIRLFPDAAMLPTAEDMAEAIAADAAGTWSPNSPILSAQERAEANIAVQDELVARARHQAASDAATARRAKAYADRVDDDDDDEYYEGEKSMSDDAPDEAAAELAELVRDAFLSLVLAWWLRRAGAERWQAAAVVIVGNHLWGIRRAIERR